MKNYLIIGLTLLLIGCEEKQDRKGFRVNSDSPEETEIQKSGLSTDSVFHTRPSSILLTSVPDHRLIPVYKLNYREDRSGKSYYIGSNAFHSSYWSHGRENNWHNNFMPGFEAMYGYNLVNIQHHNTRTKKTTRFFKEPVLIKTLYYPTFSKDTLNGKPVQRNYCMVSAYNEDTNQDGFINTDDLRRFFLFDTSGVLIRNIIPEEYSVQSSQYDPANDYMYVFAVKDENGNGLREAKERVQVFWIDLADPGEGAFMN